ncbi:MAG: type I 3-dehydroquinate dehydratase [Simkaniaceae bacterium]|nr:type I 3-dehydroquinate dehydratase [Simkaniaceae bacterium]
MHQLFYTPSSKARLKSGFDGIELRLDLININDVCALLKEIFVPTLVTMGDQLHHLDRILEMNPTYVDVSCPKAAKKVMQSACKCILSYHDFEKTPQLETLEIFSHPAHYYKVATQALSSLDSLRMITFCQKHPNVIGLCMGDKGKITRLLAPILPLPLSFTGGVAPGQLTEEEMACYHFDKLNTKTKLYALIGDPVVQSPSHIMHNAYFRELNVNALYVKIQLEKAELAQGIHYMKEIGFSGASVTMPHKTDVVQYLKRMGTCVEQIGACNTLAFSPELTGINTDGIGALNAIGNVKGKRISILGRGGAARAIAHEAKKRGAHIELVGRNQTPKNYDILVQATPVGMCGKKSPITRVNGEIFLETIMCGTPLLQQAKKQGVKSIEGLQMFRAQAIEQMKFWGIS